MQPQREDYDFDLDKALSAVVGLKATVPADAFTAETLGTERAGSGVLIDAKGLVLTIGYLITEAEQIWLTLATGKIVPGHVLGYDQETGFGLVQALARLDTAYLPLGSSARLRPGESVVVAASGGRAKSIAAIVQAKQEFAGYWEYVLDEALFTSPAHPTWSGTAVIGSGGELVGIGSLQLQQGGDTAGKGAVDVNMAVPIDVLKPILDDLRTTGRRRGPARPWLGLFATEVGERIVVAGISGRGPARKADLRPGDVILRVGAHEVTSLAGFFRAIWAQGPAGVEVPIVVIREGRQMAVNVRSVDRAKLLKGPMIH